MAIFPLPLEALLGKAGMYLVYLLIGFGFGYALEISGFNDSPRLAAQFYFKDMRVLKVMFTAIVVAMVMLFGASAIGLLDYNLIWVNPTYLWSGILGGLIMGVGFIIGGFCPGTSLVAAATLKIDGILFVLGGLVGVTLFGETEKFFSGFYNGSYFGRVTLMDVFNLPAGVVVLIVVLMALFMFWGGEQLERIVGKKDLSKESKLKYAGAIALVLSALTVTLIGQPTGEEKWARIADEKNAALYAREVQIQQGELLASMADNRLSVVLLDVRAETEFNLFHLNGARNVPLAENPDLAQELLLQHTATSVYVLMSNDETAATQAWKTLVSESVPNVYILEGGINQWIAMFGKMDTGIHPTSAYTDEDTLNFTFPAALGDRYKSSHPSPHEYELEFVPKIKLERKRGPSGGGCG